MKKYMPVFLFVVLLGFNAQAVRAMPNDGIFNSGCTSTSGFSTTTGQPCGNSSTTVGCATGNAFSSVTGQPCNGVSSGSTSGGGSSSSGSATIPSLTQNLQTGSRGAEVMVLQRFLKAEGYFFGRADGRYGRVTARAVGDFQDDMDLSATGIVDSATRALINATIAGGLKEFVATPTVPVIPTPTPVQTTFPAGCTSNSGFSMTTGESCGSTTPVTPINNATVSAKLLRQTDDKAGRWYAFTKDGTNDWVWNMYLNLPSPKTIKSVSIVHNVSGEGWSTGSSQSLLGKILYPIVVTTQDGTQLNSAYDQKYSYNTSAPSYGNFEIPAGSYSFKLYGNVGASTFIGGKIYVEFTDGTSASEYISTSDYSPNTPPVIPMPVPPSVTVLAPNGGEAFVLGSTAKVRWTMNGNLYPYVSVYLQPEGSSTVYAIASARSTASLYLSSSGQYGFDWYVGDGISNATGKYKILVQNHSGTEGSIDAKDYSDSSFTITAPVIPVAPSTVSANLLRETYDKAGPWYTFAKDGTKDWVWNMYLNLGSPKTIKSVSIVHNASGEGWSTASGSSLLGKILYPLVVTTTNDVQLNSSYDQKYSYNTSSPAYGNFEIPAGGYNFRLFGDVGASTFTGGKIYVEFTDGTSVSEYISASDYVPTDLPSVSSNLGLSASAYSALVSLPSGCSSKSGFSPTTGRSCSGN